MGFLDITMPDCKCKYKVNQFHFHTPSEHLVEGKSFSLEMHIVHTLVEGAPADYKYTKAVIGIVFDDTEDISSPFLATLHPEAKEPIVRLDLQKFVTSIPPKLFHYKGSLTTPPCSEIVNW
jgi:carbonic anhydrase